MRFQRALNIITPALAPAALIERTVLITYVFHVVVLYGFWEVGEEIDVLFCWVFSQEF